MAMFSSVVQRTIPTGPENSWICDSVGTDHADLRKSADCRLPTNGLGTGDLAVCGAPFELRAIINHDDRFTGRFTRTADDNLATAVLRFF